MISSFEAIFLIAKRYPPYYRYLNAYKTKINLIQLCHT